MTSAFQKTPVVRCISVWIIFSFIGSTLQPVAHAQTPLDLPAPGTMINLSQPYAPVMIKGLTIHKDNPFLFDFIVDEGQEHMTAPALKAEGEKLVKYFLATLAVPDKDNWVNLSPYEKNRMITKALGDTAMGRDLLEQDYILKQLTASLIYPEKNLGKKFWDRVYSKAQQMYGTSQIPVNTFNKVWIVADKAEVYEHGQSVFVVSGHLKVMLEQDYLALKEHQGLPGDTFTRRCPQAGCQANEATKVKATQGTVGPRGQATHTIASQIIRQIILPELEKEVNTGKNFANLRQIYNSVILATWYKRNLKQALLNQVYANQSKVKGINLSDPSVKEQIYQQYLKAYKKGVFNYIKEDDVNGQVIPRKYFSGGMQVDPAQIVSDSALVAQEKLAKEPLRNEFDLAVLVDTGSGQMPTDAAMQHLATPSSSQSLLGHARYIDAKAASDHHYEFFKAPAQRPFEGVGESKGPYYTGVYSFINAIHASEFSRQQHDVLAYLHQQTAPQTSYDRWVKSVQRLSSAEQDPNSYKSLQDLHGSYAFQIEQNGPWYLAGFYGDSETVEDVTVINLSTMREINYFKNPHLAYTSRATIRVNGKKRTVEFFGSEINPDITADHWQRKVTISLPPDADMWAVVKVRKQTRIYPFSGRTVNFSVKGILRGITEIDHPKLDRFGNWIVSDIDHIDSAFVIMSYAKKKLQGITHHRGIKGSVPYWSIPNYEYQPFLEFLIKLKSDVKKEPGRYGRMRIIREPRVLLGSKNYSVEEFLRAIELIRKYFKDGVVKNIGDYGPGSDIMTVAQMQGQLGVSHYLSVGDRAPYWRIPTGKINRFKRWLDGQEKTVNARANRIKSTGTKGQSDKAMLSEIENAKLAISFYLELLSGISLAEQDKEILKAWRSTLSDLHPSVKDNNLSQVLQVLKDIESTVRSAYGHLLPGIGFRSSKDGVSLNFRGIGSIIIIITHEDYLRVFDVHGKTNGSMSRNKLLEYLKGIPERTKSRDFEDGLLKLMTKDKFPGSKDRVVLSQPKPVDGGIDLSTANQQWTVRSDGQGVVMNIDPTMLERIRKQGIDWAVPVVLKVTPVASIWTLIGMQAPAQPEQLAKA